MISTANLNQTRYWLDRFRDIHDEGVPLVLHSHEVDGNGAPQWSPQFRMRLTEAGHSDASRLKRAMKKVRQHSLREYEVLRRVMSGEPIDEVTDWLNDRAVRGGHPERYTAASTTVIIFAAVDKLQAWY